MLMREYTLMKMISYNEIVSILKKSKVLDIDHSKEIVMFSLFVLFINGKPGVHMFLEGFLYLLKRIGHFDGNHIYAGDHDILCFSIGEFEHIEDHLPLFGFKHSVLVSRLNVCLYLRLGDGFMMIFIDLKKLLNALCYRINDKYDGCQDYHYGINYPGISK